VYTVAGAAARVKVFGNIGATIQAMPHLQLIGVNQPARIIFMCEKMNGKLPIAYFCGETHRRP
jgi:hypothetical protein